MMQEKLLSYTELAFSIIYALHYINLNW